MIAIPPQACGAGRMKPEKKPLHVLGACLLAGLILAGCAARSPQSAPEASQQGPAREQANGDRRPDARPDHTDQRQQSRSLASLQLVQAGRSLINEGRPDEAIRMLERAVNLNPRSGRAYYYLAEAWLMKDGADQAAEYNRLAAMHLSDDPSWRTRLRAQAEQIQDWLD